jgi:hypothetical protein
MRAAKIIVLSGLIILTCVFTVARISAQAKLSLEDRVSVLERKVDAIMLLLEEVGRTKPRSSQSPSASKPTPKPKGTVALDRFWVEDLTVTRYVYALITYKNNTKRTFRSVVSIVAITYDEHGKKLNMASLSFFAHARGPIEPGFTGSLKIPIEVQSGDTVVRVECKVSEAR